MLVRLADTATGVALILVDAAGENLIAVAPGANARAHRRARARRARAAEPARRATSSSSTHEIPTAAAREALRIGRAGGAPTVLNPAPGRRHRPADPLARGRPDAQPRRARALAAAGARRSGRRTSGAEDPVMAARALLDATSEGPGVARAVSCRSAPRAPCSCGATVRRSTSRRRG